MVFANLLEVDVCPNLSNILLNSLYDSVETR